ncbi:MAG: heavy metal translocating P-type ATPase metal-binding domain-containing protein, partial [Rhodospirillales bacterium]|nr:heavy metal translocating P-type ATPase metal-binding domain-containing protein [Rhodospirillales bacterium]
MTAVTADRLLHAASAEAAETVCAHCGQPIPDGGGSGARGPRFCCPGCSAAFETIQGLGLGRYYQQRLLDPALRAPRPETGERWDLDRAVTVNADGTCELSMAIDGLQCGACVWLIESVLGREPAVVAGRVNMTSRRLRLVWRGVAADGEPLVGRI